MPGIRQLRQIQLGRETTAGTAVAATPRWGGLGAMEDTREVTFPEEFIGIIGGGIGYALKTAISQGAKRGLFSNEAGMGSAPNIAAVAVPNPHHPASQGFVQALTRILEVVAALLLELAQYALLWLLLGASATVLAVPLVAACALARPSASRSADAYRIMLHSRCDPFASRGADGLRAGCRRASVPANSVAERVVLPMRRGVRSPPRNHRVRRETSANVDAGQTFVSVRGDESMRHCVMRGWRWPEQKACCGCLKTYRPFVVWPASPMSVKQQSRRVYQQAVTRNRF